MNKKIRFFVLNNNIPGYMCQDNKRFFGILHSSVLRGQQYPRNKVGFMSQRNRFFDPQP